MWERYKLVFSSALIPPDTGMPSLAAAATTLDVALLGGGASLSLIQEVFPTPPTLVGWNRERGGIVPGG